MDNELNRFYIKIRPILEIDLKTIHEELVTALGPSAPSSTTVTRWIKRFRQEREDVNNDLRSASLLSKSTGENIQLVQQVINNDPHSTYDEIIAETSLSHSTIEQIIHDWFKMKKVPSCWVTHQLTDEQKQRVKLCPEKLAKFQNSSWRLCDIITGDEMRIYHRQIRDAIGTWNRPVRSRISYRSLYRAVETSFFRSGRSRNFFYFFLDFWSIFAKIKSRDTLFCMSNQFS